MGSLFNLHVSLWPDRESIVSTLHTAGFQLVVSTLDEAMVYHQAAYGQKIAVAVGNEGAGVSRELQQAADLRVTIPILGRAESLNVAVATGIILAELTKH
jgi:TrmH family RNA methyltransferase